MARDISEDELAARREMTSAYKRQEHRPNGFDDWGKFTAHVVCAQRAEIDRLRTLITTNGMDAGEWDDPLAVG